MTQHWYCGKTGEPRYTVIGKNGKERNTNIRDARADNLVPSVTTINSQLSKDGLSNWLQSEAIKTAAEYPRWDGESENEWVSRILELSKKKAKKLQKEALVYMTFLIAISLLIMSLSGLLMSIILENIWMPHLGTGFGYQKSHLHTKAMVVNAICIANPTQLIICQA